MLVKDAKRTKILSQITIKQNDKFIQYRNIKTDTPVLLEVSAHHIHLSREHINMIFGYGYKLTVKKELSQPGQFAANETVTLIGPDGIIEHVRVLGPERKATQIEIAMTEQYKLGIKVPIRESGEISGSPGITIKGPNRTITVKEGVICACRHIHMSPKEALSFGLYNKDVVWIRINSNRRLIFGDVVIRVNPNFRLAMHIDTDEANAADIKTGMVGFIENIQTRYCNNNSNNH